MSATIQENAPRQECDGHTHDGGPCDATCDPHIEERNRRIRRQDEIASLAHRLRGTGAITEDEASLLYQLSAAEWDDAIHVASPLNGHMSLCGQMGRNLVPLKGSLPNGVEGCWTCLRDAELLQGRL